jgi:hypothetical protein
MQKQGASPLVEFVHSIGYPAIQLRWLPPFCMMADAMDKFHPMVVHTRLKEEASFSRKSVFFLRVAENQFEAGSPSSQSPGRIIFYVIIQTGPAHTYMGPWGETATRAPC